MTCSKLPRVIARRYPACAAGDGSIRDVVRAIPGAKLRECGGGCHHNKAMCCGAGGARAFMEEKRGSRINHLRLLQAAEAEPSASATACPYCIMMLEDGTRTKGIFDELPIRDVSELLAASLDGSARADSRNGQASPGS